MRKRLVVATLVASASVLSWGGTAAHAADPNCTGRNAIASKSFTVAHTDGTTETFGYLDNQTVNDDVRPGDTVTVTFRVKAECVGEAIGLASYQAESPTFVAGEPQTLFDSETVSGSGASQSLTVTVPNAAGDGTTGCPRPRTPAPTPAAPTTPPATVARRGTATAMAPPPVVRAPAASATPMTRTRPARRPTAPMPTTATSATATRASPGRTRPTPDAGRSSSSSTSSPARSSRWSTVGTPTALA
jgi:hypothetical protein